jgi:hypothetical protein
MWHKEENVVYYFYMGQKKTSKKTKLEIKKKETKKKVPKKREKPIRIIQKQNNGSTTIALPADLLRELKWKEKQKVSISKRGEGILIEIFKKK